MLLRAFINVIIWESWKKIIPLTPHVHFKDYANHISRRTLNWARREREERRGIRELSLDALWRMLSFSYVCSVPNTFFIAYCSYLASLIYMVITFLFACSYFKCIYLIAVETLALFLSPVTSRTILNIFACFKWVGCLFEFICSCIWGRIQ